MGLAPMVELPLHQYNMAEEWLDVTAVVAGAAEKLRFVTDF